MEYARYTTNTAKNTAKKYKNNKNFYINRKTHSTTYKNDNRGDRVYLLAQLAKFKNDADKRRIKNNLINNNQSPIILHDNNGYDMYEISQEIIDQKSFDEDIYERNYNYRNNYEPINKNNNREYEEGYFYQNKQIRSPGMNDMQEEYFGENDSSYNRKEVPSPIGYIATYSSGSEDNEEMGKSYEHYTTYNNYKNIERNTKNQIDKNIYKKEGELIKKSEVIYQMEEPNEYINFYDKRKNKNLSNIMINTQIDTSKSDKRDFESPDRGHGAGVGSEKFRKVTLAMISSLGPTCEDRKITRKMRSEIGGVVDLRQELNPVNTYKIKKFQRYGYNLNIKVNPKTKLEGARIIQYWWRKLKDKKIYMIKYIKIVKIQSIIRSFLIRKRLIITKITYFIYETLENIINNHYRNEFLKLFKYSNEDKVKKKLIYVLNKLNDKNNMLKTLKYFYKFKFITDILKNKKNSSDYKIIEEEKKQITNNNINKEFIQKEIETTITEEEYIKYIKENYSNKNQLQHINELTIDKNKKNPYEIGNKTNYEIQKIKKELIDKQTQDEYIKKEYKDIGIQKEKEKMIITKKEPISYIKNKPIKKDIGTDGAPELKEIQTMESISFIKKHSNINENSENKIVNQDKIPIIYIKPNIKEEGNEGSTININEISGNNSLLIPRIKKEKKDIFVEAKPEHIIKLDNKTEISIIKPKKELKETYTQKEIEENKINNLNQISFLYQRPKTNEQGTGNFSLGEGIDKYNFKIIKEKKEFKNSETEPIIQNMELTKNNLSIIKPIKQFVEKDSQYRDPNLPTDKNNEIKKLLNKKIKKEKLFLSSIINRWRKIALGEKIKFDIDNQRIEKLRNVLKIKKTFLKKHLKNKFEEFKSICSIPEKTIELIKNENFNIIDIKPENEKVQLGGFFIERKEKPALQIDKKEDYNILKVKKTYKDNEVQISPNLEEKGVNPEIVQNKIMKNELINFIKQKKETSEKGTNPTKINNEISNISEINYINKPKQFADNETNMEKIPQEICTNEPFNIIKPKKELIDTSIQYTDPSKPTSYEEILSIIIKKKINRNNLSLRKYLKKWNKIVKKDIIDDNANIIIKNIKGYLVRNKIKKDENKNNSLTKIINIYEQIINKQLKNRWNQFKNNCKIESQKIEPKKGEYFSIIGVIPENKEEKIDEIYLKSKEKNPLEINNLENLDIFGKIKNFTEFGIQQTPNIEEKGTQNEIPKNVINNKNQLSFIHNKKIMKDEYSQNEKYKPKITSNKLNIICKIKKEDEGQQIGSWANIINKNESINIISQIKKVQKKIIPNDIKKTISLEIIKNKRELHDQEIQYIPEENKIQTLEIEIKRNKPEMKENSSQYITKNPVICKLNEYSILMNKAEKMINKYKINKKTVTILPKRKELSEKGSQYNIPKECKAKEIIIGNNIKRGSTQKIIKILDKILIKKEKTKFIYNCKEISKETKIKRELLRMALLRWRFIKGYGGDKYGIIYDRNGKEIGKKEGLVNDVSVQNNLYDEINNEKLRKKQFQIKISKQNPVYIKSNIKKKIMFSRGTGEGLNHTINTKIDNNATISYFKKPKPKNKISNKSYFKINKIEKKYISQSTYMPKEIYKIVKENRLSFINTNDKKLRNIQNRRRDLLTQIISKSSLREKYILNNNFSKWYKKTMKIYYYEKKNLIYKKSNPKISKNEKFEILTKIIKRDKSVGNIYVPNQIAHNSKIEFKNNKLKKDFGVLIDLPNLFKKENLKTRKINNDIYKSYKKPKILIPVKGESIFFIAPKDNKGKNYIRKEIEDEINIRITEIFVKFIKTRNSPICILRKYLSIWHRKSQYLSLSQNAKIITNFCRMKLKSVLVRKRWKKLYSKYSFSIRQYKIMKIIKQLREKRSRLLRLIRMTSLITKFNKRKYIHKVLMCWLIYTISSIKKRNQVKIIYENMLTTYISMADDIFGRNQKNNPSIQDSMFEIIDTNKFQTKELEDVPIAKIYYSKKDGKRQIFTNIKNIEKETEEKQCTFYKKMVKSYYSPQSFNKFNKYNTQTEDKKSNTEKSEIIKFNKYKTQTEDKKSKIEKSEIINKRINNNTSDNFYINHKERSLGEAKYGRRNNNTYKIQNLSTGERNKSSVQSIARYGRRNNKDKNINENNKSNMSSNNNNNRYSSINDEKKEMNKTIEGKYNKNNNIKSYNNIFTKDQKNEVNKNNTFYRNKYNRFKYDNNKKDEDKMKINDEEKKDNKNKVGIYYNKVKPENKSFYNYQISDTGKNKQKERKKI